MKLSNAAMGWLYNLFFIGAPYRSSTDDDERSSFCRSRDSGGGRRYGSFVTIIKYELQLLGSERGFYAKRNSPKASSGTRRTSKLWGPDGESGFVGRGYGNGLADGMFS